MSSTASNTIISNSIMSKNIYIVIPVHNRKNITRKCLVCLKEQSLVEHNVIVVDDGSTDGTSEMIRNEFPDITLLQGNGELWWAGATNKGCQYALEHGAELILTLNDDVIVKNDYLENLVEAHRKQPKALIGSINLSQEDAPRLLDAGIESFNPWTAKYGKRGALMTPYNNDLSGLLPTYNLPGRGVLVPQAVFELIGFFDDVHLKHYAADYDFSLRAAKAGFPLLVNVDNPVYSPYEPKRPGGTRQSFAAFIQSFFQFRSSNYLPVTLRYNFRHHPMKWYFPVFAAFDFSRKLFSFIRNRMC